MAGLCHSLRDRVSKPSGFRDGMGGWGGESWNNICEGMLLPTPSPVGSKLSKCVDPFLISRNLMSLT